MKVLDSIWFCAGHGNVGVIKCFNDFDGLFYYIGQCQGVDKETDEQWIANWGSRFPYKAGQVLFGDQYDTE